MLFGVSVCLYFTKTSCVVPVMIYGKIVPFKPFPSKSAIKG